METKTKTEPFDTKKNSIVNNESSVKKTIEKIIPLHILIVGTLFSFLLFLANIYEFHFDWKIPFIPILIAIQIVFLVLALKNRYKKL